MHSKVGTSSLGHTSSFDSMFMEQILCPLPLGAKLLSVHLEDNNIWLNFLYDNDEKEYMDKEFAVLSPFGALPDNDLFGWRFVGTVVQEAGNPHAWHVFVRVV